MQTDTSPPTFWKIVAVSGGFATWRQITTAADVTMSAIATILGSEPAWWIDGITSTITDAGGGVASSATDASGNGQDATFGSGARPSIIASGLNSKRTLRFTTAQYGGNAGTVNPTPGTQFTYAFMIAKMITNVANGCYLTLGTAGQLAVYHDSGQNPTSYNGTVKPGPTTPSGTWHRFEALFSNSSSDYTAVDGTPGTLGNAGNNAISAGYTLNGNINGTGLGNVEFATSFVWRGAAAPTSPQRAALASWASTLWGI